MKYLMFPLLIGVLLSCSAPPSEKRIDIELRNTTDRTIELRASMGFFGRKIKLEPGEVWYGWIHRDMAGKEIRIDVKDSSQAHAKK